VFSDLLAAMSTTTGSLPDFTPYRSIIEDLYWKQRKTLDEVIKIMKDDYGFEARHKRYKTHLSKWGKKKNVSEEESLAMLEIRRRRRLEENKDTEFTRFDRDIDNRNLDRFAKRHNYDMGSSNPLPEIRGSTYPSPFCYHSGDFADTRLDSGNSPEHQVQNPRH
jgi:hypothetical protein